MLELQAITKDYRSGTECVHALRGVSLRFRDNEFVSILGPSGCGKTTLLNIIGGLDRYTAGDLLINGVSTKQYATGTGTPTATTPSALSFRATISSRTRACWQTSSWL